MKTVFVNDCAADGCYKNVGKGSRNDDGSVFKNNKRDDDLDVVLVFKNGLNKKELLKNLNIRYEQGR